MVDVLDKPTPAAAAHPTSPSEMLDRPGLDVPSARKPPLATPPATKKAEGLPPITWAMAAIAIAMLLWGAWVTKHIASPAAAVPMASVRLEAIVSEYVQAQSHSNGQPDAVAAQTRAFMGTLDQELQKIGASGTTVLVGEATIHPRKTTTSSSHRPRTRSCGAILDRTPARSESESSACRVRSSSTGDLTSMLMASALPI